MRDMRLILVTLIGLCSSGLFGQYGSFGITDARSVALGNNYVTNSYGLLSIGKNPALMTYASDDRHQVHVFFPNVTALSLNISEALDFFGGMFTGKKSDLIEGLTDKKLKSVFDGNGRASVIGSIDFLAIGYQHSQKIGFFGFTVNEYVSTYLKLPQVIVDFSDGIGNPGNTSLNDFKFKTWWIRSYSLSYSRKIVTGPFDGIEGIYLGGAVKYYSGFAYTDIVLNSTSSFFTDESLLYSEFTALISSAFSTDLRESIFGDSGSELKYPGLSPSGKGAGFDLGVSIVFDRGVNFAASITDIGKMNWTKGARFYEVNGIINISRDLTLEDIRNLGDSIVITESGNDEFSTGSPTALHIGLGFQLHKMINKFPGYLNISWEVHQGLNESPGNSEFIKTGVGLEYYYKDRLPILLTGISNSRDSELMWSLGLGYKYKFLHIYLSTMNLLAYFDPDAPVSISFATYWIISFGGRKNKQMQP